MLKVIYGSVYGHTQKYAETFAEKFDVQAVNYKEAKKLDPSAVVVYFGGLYAGGLKGISTLKEDLQTIVVVTVGLSDPHNPENIESIKKSVQINMDEELYSRAKSFHLRGGIDYANIRLHHRLMMRLLHMKVKQTPESDQSEETKTMIATYGSKVNFVDLTTLKPLRHM